MTPRRALLVVVLLSSLTTCDDEPTPEIPDPTSAVSTPTVTDSVSPTTPTSTPAVVLTPEETVRAWVAARNQALQDGDTSVVEALSAATCEACEFALDPIRTVYEAGGHFDTDGWTLSGLKLKNESGDRAVLDSGLIYEAGSTVPQAGAEPIAYDREEHIVRFRLGKEGERWLLELLVYYS